MLRRSFGDQKKVSKEKAIAISLQAKKLTRSCHARRASYDIEYVFVSEENTLRLLHHCIHGKHDRPIVSNVKKKIDNIDVDEPYCLTMHSDMSEGVGV